jgi:dUTPase
VPIEVARARSLRIPAGAFALVVTKERVKLSADYAGHLGLRSDFARKGLLLLAGLQIDPGFDGHLVLGLANLSPRAVDLSYEEPVATLDLHRLTRAAAMAYSGLYAGQQVKPVLPRADADYLRTIETLSVSDLTRSLLRLSDNVAALSRDVRKVYLPIALAILVAVVVQIILH